MTVVLDSPAIIAVAANTSGKRTLVETALETEACYMSVVAVAEAYSWILNNAAAQLAEYWLGFLSSGRDVRVFSDIGREMVELVAIARQSRTVSITGAFSAALAHKLGVPLLTDDLNLSDLEARDFCSIKWL
jgi:predicted nucleic acid-binding protein